MSVRRGRVLVIAFALFPASAKAGDVELLPDVSAKLEGAYYVPSEEAFVWDTWIGAGAGLLRVRTVTAHLSANVETVLGRERRPFDPTQANYHLEGGVRIALGRHQVEPFFHHVSRHVVDRPKNTLVDWNVLGLGIAGPLPAAVAGRYWASVGHTVEWRAVGYEWELAGAFDADVWRPAWGTLFLRGGVRLVTVDPQSAIPRGSFADVLVEGGARFTKGGRWLDLFAAYEHRNDVFLLVPSVRDRALFGLRIGLATADGDGRGDPAGRLLGR